MLKLRNFIIPAVALISFTAFQSFNTGPEYPNKESLLMDVVLQSLRYNHYAPQDIDDAYSEKVYKVYLDRLDNGKRYFLQKDIDSLAKYEHLLDDHAISRNFEFFDKVHEILNRRMSSVQNY